MLKLISQACLSGASDYATAFEVGFVPERVTVINRTTFAELQWTKNTIVTQPASFLKRLSGGLVTHTLLSANGLTVIDGSDKTNYVTQSFGFLLPKIVDLNDTAGEILDITVERTDL
jgi:hypothetical protein